MESSDGAKPENIPREPENAPEEEENTSKEEKVKTHDEAGIRKEEEVTTNLLIQFRREIQKLEECLSDIEQKTF
ncbi:hypothetical protein CVS40_11584 [Lucilia cuprina]|nr:hypothetical protein CVS40_11584 [Lucilia cuprina]